MRGNSLVLNSNDIPAFKSASPDETALVKSVLGPGVKVERMFVQAAVTNVFRVSENDRPPRLFYIHRPDDFESVSEIYELSSWFFKNGVATPEPLIPPTQTKGKFTYAYSVRQFVPQCQTAPNEQYMKSLARAVAHFHTVASHHPSKDEWTRRTDRRIDGLIKSRGKIARGQWRAGPEPDQLRCMARDLDLDFKKASADRFALHGDLHKGNVLVNHDDKTLFIIDFEDVPHSVLPLAFELSLILERHIFARVRDEGRALELSNLFLKSYAGFFEFDPSLLPESDELYQAILSLNFRSLCVLALSDRMGIEFPQSEWNKFLTMFRRAKMQRRYWQSLRYN